MAGQVDVIISKQAIKEIQIATAQLEQLRIKILQVNKAGAKSGGVGVSDNQALTSQLATLNKLVVANNKLSVSANKRLNAIKKNTAATNQSTSANKRNANSLGGIGKVLKGGGILFALMKLKDLTVSLVKDVFNLAKQFDSLRFALERTSASLLEAKMNSAFMLKLSNDLGLSLIATTTRFIKFAAAARNSGLAMKDVQKIFGTMAKAGAVLGLRTDELSGVFLALEQMLSKGKVTTEELRRQLGERLPGAFGIMAASLGVTLPKLDEMLKKGELLSAEVLPGFADAVEQAFGLETVDKVETLVASQNRLTTSWQNFVKNLTEEGSVVKGVFKTILDTIGESIKILDSYVNSKEFFNSEYMAFGFDIETDILWILFINTKHNESNSFVNISSLLLMKNFQHIII
jgi:tape measure domain-containing protein